MAIRYAVLGPPRSASGHDPYCFVWIEWVERNPFFFDLDKKRFANGSNTRFQLAGYGRGARILTHCNAGWLACVDWGTALSPVYFAKRQGKKIFVLGLFPWKLV